MDLAAQASKSGLRSAAGLAATLIAAGLEDLRAGRLRVLPGGVIERISDQPLPRQSPKPRQRKETNRKQSKGSARQQTKPTAAPVSPAPSQNLSTANFPEPLGSHGQSSPDHSARHHSEATANPVQPTNQRPAPPAHKPATPAPDLTPEEREYLQHPGIVLNPETGRPMVRTDPPIGVDIGLWNARRDYVIRGDEVDEETIPLLEGLVWNTPAE